MVSQLSARTLEQIKSPRVRRFFDYWHSKRQPGQKFPLRKDIDATELRELLPLVSILDVEYNPLRLRYRLVGTRVVEYNHQEFTGQYLGQVGWNGEEMLRTAYETAVMEQRPHFGFYMWDLVSGGIGRCEFALLPLTNDGEIIHQVLSMEDYEFPLRDVDPDRV